MPVILLRQAAVQGEADTAVAEVVTAAEAGQEAADTAAEAGMEAEDINPYLGKSH